MKKVPENILTQEIYTPAKGKGLKRWLLVFLLFFVSFFLAFPFEKTLENSVQNMIASQRACPIRYDKMQITWFSPGFSFQNPVISGACLGKPGSDIALTDLNLSFAGPNFSPFGLRLKMKAISAQSRLIAYPAIGFGQQVVRVSESIIGEDLLSALIGMDIISGQIQVDGLVELAQNQVSSAKFKIESADLNSKNANIVGFNLPPMQLGALTLLLELDAAGKVFIEKLSLGDIDSTIAANFKGNITLNRYNMLFSNADLIGEVRFSDQFFKAVPIVKLLLQGKQATEGFYKLEIKGPLGQTRPNFL